MLRIFMLLVCLRIFFSLAVRKESRSSARLFTASNVSCGTSPLPELALPTSLARRASDLGLRPLSLVASFTNDLRDLSFLLSFAYLAPLSVVERCSGLWRAGL